MGKYTLLCIEYILLFRLIIYVLYSFTLSFSTFYIGLPFTHTVACANIWSSQYLASCDGHYVSRPNSWSYSIAWLLNLQWYWYYFIPTSDRQHGKPTLYWLDHRYQIILSPCKSLKSTRVHSFLLDVPIISVGVVGCKFSLGNLYWEGSRHSKQ